MRTKIKFFLVGFFSVAITLLVCIQQNIIRLPIERAIEAQYAIDLSNDRILAGFSDNIYVGKVIRRGENGQSEIGPTTSYSIEVLYQIKGSLSEKTTVRQYGGYENGIFYAVENDQALKEGATYLFASRSYDESNWLLYAPFGHLTISEDSSIQISELGKNNLVKRFELAVQTQIPFVNKPGL